MSYEFLSYFSTILTNSLAERVECSPMVQETGIQSQVTSYQDFKNGTWYLLV